MFLADWYDANAGIIRKYQLLYYAKDASVEMYDCKNRRTFLKKSKVDNIKLSDLYIGNTVNLYSRQLKFVDYGDEYTRKKLSCKKEKTFAMIKPDALDKLGPIIDMIHQRGFLITKLKMCQMSSGEVAEFYREHQDKPFFGTLIRFASSGPVVAFELVGDSAVSRWRETLGPTDSATARRDAPTSIRAKFGEDTTRNACHGSDSLDSAARELEFFFPTSGPGRKNTAKFSNCTCCIIKPHIVAAGLSGKIISSILEVGFEISALQMFCLDRANAEEFLEVYKGVVHEYASMVEEITEGPCIALEIRGHGENIPQQFREMVGPSDPEIARHLRPRTLRANYGVDKIRNAVHCTDLAEDGPLEVDYFFKLLDQ